MDKADKEEDEEKYDDNSPQVGKYEHADLLTLLL